ncbi:MAG: hypothetical protein ACRC0X_05420 [Brevinema sp.]
MNELKKQLDTEYKRKMSKLGRRNILRNAIPTGAFLLYMILSKPSEGSTESLIALVLYASVTTAVSIPYFIEYKKLTKEHNLKLSELEGNISLK